jgi:hypothetical protein
VQGIGKRLTQAVFDQTLANAGLWGNRVIKSWSRVSEKTI